MTEEKQTSRIHRIMVRAAIGAIIGGCTVSAWVAMIAESRFFFDTLAVLGTGGLIGGAICGVIFGAFGGKIGLAMAGVLGGIVGCALMMFGMLWYVVTPWPAPEPYSDVEVQVQSYAPGS
jgi:hypothetical protein